MALAASLIPGFKYRVLKGPFADEIVTIVDNTPFPDGDREGRQRKITILTPMGDEDYILPRLLSDRPEDVAVADAPVYNTPAVTPPVLDMLTPVGGDSAAVAQSLRLSPITDPMDPRLDHLRPSRAKVKHYINRIMANGNTDIDMLLHFTSDDVPLPRTRAVPPTSC